MNITARQPALRMLLALGLSLTMGCPRDPGPLATKAASPAAPVAPARPAATAGAAPDVRLVVLIVIDQMPSWMFERDAQVSRQRGGAVARLLEHGTYVPRAELPYSITSTAPGHAVLGTGAPPVVTRILGNFWYDAATGQTVSPVADDASPVFDIAASRPGAPAFRPAGASGIKLAVPGVADALRQATGGRGKAVSISWKDRSAILGTGQRPTLAIWYDGAQVAMTTSRYYRDEPPAWLLELARTHPVASRLGAVWTPLAGLDHAGITGVADDSPGEAGTHDFDATFPHPLADTARPAQALRSTPFASELVLETGMAALAGENLGADDIPDLLALSFSAHDYAGHRWGQESWERLDTFVRLDDALAGFLAELDRRVGRDHYAVVLTSDHGAARMVEHSQRAGKQAARLFMDDLLAVANNAAAKVLADERKEAPASGGPWVAEQSSSSLHGTPAFHALDPRQRDAALDAMVATLARVPGMAYVARADRVTGQCDQRTGMDARVCLSMVAGLSGDIVIAPAPGYLITRSTFGTEHNSPNPDDSAVPVIVMAPGWPAGTSQIPTTLLQVAPTLTELLGVPRPAAAKEPPLTPALAAPPASPPQPAVAPASR